MMESSRPAFEPRRCDDLADVRVGVAWTELADPLVRDRVQQAAAHFPHATPLDLPLSDDTGPSSAARSPRSTTTCGATTATPTATTSPARSSWRWRSRTRGDGGRAARERYRERWAQLTADVDLVLTPTLRSSRRAPRSARSRSATDPAVHLPVQRARRARVWRCRAALPSMACRRRFSSAGAPATTAWCSRPGRCWSGP